MAPSDRPARPHPSTGIDHLVVARESNAKDLPLLEGMIIQTLERYPDLPGRERLMELGAKPVRAPASVSGRALRKHGTKAVLFSIDGTACLYSQGSAAKDETNDRENGFVEMLCGVIATHRPKNIYVATFSRLVRSFYQSGPVQRALEDAKCTLHYSEGQPINFAYPDAVLRWSTMTAFADMERNSVVTRMMLGRVGKHRQKKWILTPSAVPMGYRLDDSKRLVIDQRPGVAEAVRKAIRLMADPEIGMQEIGLALGAIGVGPPRKNRGSNWSYDPEWEWDGQVYVPRARRPADEAVHLLPRKRPRSASRETISDYAMPELVGKRIIKTLDLWATGTTSFSYANPMPNTSRYAEYLVETGPDGRSAVKFDYTPGLPDNGWAPADELAQARAVRDQIAAVEATRAHSNAMQMPLLGELGRWNEDGYRYALLSANSKHGRYELQRQVLPDPIPLSSEGEPIWPSFKHQSQRLGERLARIDAGELHRAIASALTEALENGVNIAPHPSYPPSAIDPVSRTLIDTLRAEKARLEARAANATDNLLETRNPPASVRAHLVADLDRALAESTAAAAALEAALAQNTTTYPATMITRPHDLAQALAVLAHTNKQTPRDVTQAVNTVLSDLRLQPNGLRVDGTITANVAAEDGLLVIGPVAFQVHQRMGSRRARGQWAEPETVRRTRSRDLAEALLTTEASLADIADTAALDGDAERRRVVRYLTDGGMPQAAALRALDCVPAVTRAVIWALLEDVDPPEGLDPGFIERIRVEFFEDTRRAKWWWRRTGPRQAATDYLRERGGTITVEDFQRWIRRQHPNQSTKNLGDAYKTIVSAPSVEPGRDRPSMWATITVGRRSEGSCRPDCPPRCWDHRPVKLRQCPHCHGLADHHVPVGEVPTGLLCGTCLREPTPDTAKSPVYPTDYLTLTAEDHEARRESINPRSHKKGNLRKVTRPVRDNARAWAIENGLREPGGQHITQELVDQYLLAVGNGDVMDSKVIREWANENGLDVGDRGRIPELVVTAYRRDLADRMPKMARDWARAQGLAVPRTGLTDDVLNQFAAYRLPVPEPEEAHD